MPHKSIAIEYVENDPSKKKLKGGVVDRETMRFETTWENLKYSLSISGSQDDVRKNFSNWPIEVGKDIELKINTKMNQKLIDVIAQRAADEIAAKAARGKSGKQPSSDPDDDDISAMSDEIDKV